MRFCTRLSRCMQQYNLKQWDGITAIVLVKQQGKCTGNSTCKLCAFVGCFFFLAAPYLLAKLPTLMFITNMSPRWADVPPEQASWELGPNHSCLRLWYTQNGFFPTGLLGPEHCLLCCYWWLKNLSLTRLCTFWRFHLNALTCAFSQRKNKKKR